MSLSQEKTPKRRFKFSLATRLTMWYAATAFLTALVAIGGLYYLFQKNLEREADRALSDRLRDLQSIIRTAGVFNTQALQDEFAEQSSRRRVVPIYYRVLKMDGSVDTESGEFRDKADGVAFPPPSSGSEPVRILFAYGKDQVPLRLTSVVMVTTSETRQEQRIIQAAINI